MPPVSGVGIPDSPVHNHRHKRGLEKIRSFSSNANNSSCSHDDNPEISFLCPRFCLQLYELFSFMESISKIY